MGVRGDAPALHLPDKTLDYASLRNRVAGLAASLQDFGLTPSATIALLTESTSFIALMAHAAPLIGCTLFPLDPKLPPAWRNRLLEQAGVDAVLCDEADDTYPPLLKVYRIGSLPTQMAPFATKDVLSPGVQLIVASSGSSAKPRGGMLSPANLDASVKSANERLDLRLGDCWLDCLPLFHIGGLAILFRASAAGASVVLHQGFDAVTVWADLQWHSVTHLSLVPAMLAKLLDVANERPPPETLRVVLVGGAHLNSHLAKRALDSGWPLCVSYGLSETSSQVATRCLAQRSEVEPGNVGKPLHGFEVRVADETGRPTTGVGWIHIRGKAVMVGYANPEHRPGDGLDDGWLVSGDLGQLDESGRLTIVGRADEVLVSGGENIHPLQVEDLIMDCSAVDEVVVIGKADPVWGERIVAIYSGTIDVNELQRWCRTHIRGALRPREFIRRKSFPRLTNGKVDRKRVRECG